MMSEEIEITVHELRQYYGDVRPMYVSYNGIVYDVTNSFRWRNGLHEGQHFSGQDLTSELADAPHGEDVFRHPAVKRIGILINNR